MSDDGSLLAQLGVVVDRDYAMPAHVWEIAMRVAAASMEGSRRDG